MRTNSYTNVAYLTPENFRSEKIEKTILRKRTVLDEIKTFFYETPVLLLALLTAGVALLSIFPPIGTVLIGYSPSALAARTVFTVIDCISRNVLLPLRTRLFALHLKIRYLDKIALLIAAAVSCVLPYLGLGLALVAGTYKGTIIQLDIRKHQQQINRYRT